MDRLTIAPNDVIDKILFLVPFREVVRLSIVNHELQFAWTRQSQIILDKNFWKDNNGNLRPSEYFFRALHGVLQHHAGQMVCFSLDIPPLDPPQIYTLNQIIVALEGKHVRYLLISNALNPYPYILPRQLYLGNYLEVLYFNNCTLPPPPLDFLGFCNLTKLMLSKVIIPRAIGGRLRMLTSVYFDSCEGIHHLGWSDSQEIKSFTMMSSRQFRFGTLSGLCLRTLKIYAREVMVRENNIDLEWLNRNFSSLTKLLIDGFCLQFLARYMTIRLYPGFRYLTDITFHDLFIQNVDQMSCSMCILRSVPNLTRLWIMSSIFEGLAKDYQEPASVEMSFPCLRQVKIRLRNSVIPATFWMKIILANSPTLQTVKVECGRLAEVIELMDVVQLFPKANPAAQVLFKEV